MAPLKSTRMRVFALTFGGADYASSFYRVVQFQKPLRDYGIELEICPIKSFAWRGSLMEYDLVLLQKKLVPRRKLGWLLRNSRKLVFDTDDAIWHAQKGAHHWWTNWRTRGRLRAIVRHAKACLTANSVLASYLERWNPRVSVFPMALDETIWTQKIERVDEPKPVRIGWAGKGVNLPYLHAIEPALATLKRKCPSVEFAVYSGERPKFSELAYEYLPYRPGTEPEAIRTFDIGLLPLAEGPFAEGKSPIKALQYMACGIASVVSPRGATRDMFEQGQSAVFAETDDEWLRGLERLVGDRALRLGIGSAARERFERTYALRAAVPKLAGLLRSITETEA